MKIAFFDAKPYDKPSFEKYGEPAGISFKYLKPNSTKTQSIWHRATTVSAYS